MQSGKEGKIKDECWSVRSVERMDQRNKSMVRRIPSGEDEHGNFTASEGFQIKLFQNIRDYQSLPGHYQILITIPFQVISKYQITIHLRKAKENLRTSEFSYQKLKNQMLAFIKL